MSDRYFPSKDSRRNFYARDENARYDAKEEIKEGRYEDAIESLETAGVYYLKLAGKPNLSPRERLKLLSLAIGDYKSAQEVVNRQQKIARTPGGKKADVPYLVKKSSELGSTIRKLRGMQDKLTFQGEGARSLESSLGGKVIGLFSIAILVLAIVSISMNLTGNVIGGSSDNNNWISIGLFFLGCLLTLFYFKIKKS